MITAIDQVRFDRFRFDRLTGRLWADEQEVRLTPKAAAVMTLLVEHRGDPVTKAELFASIWPDTAVSDDALTTCIFELRRALGDDARQPRFIETRHRRGYRFVAPAVRVEGAAPVRSVHDATHSRPEGSPMIAGAKYGHTNLIAKDWRRLAGFYQEQFGCTPVPPERDFKGRDLERGTGIPGAELRGVHLRLPGHGADGPTLEIFNYNVLENRPGVAVNRPGFGHIAFVVDDVPEARAAVLAAGGQSVGEVVTLTTATGSQVTWVYVTDPEGNVIELQSWSK